MRASNAHVLEAVDERTIRPIAELVHHIFYRYEVLDINGRRVLKAVGCRGRIEVYKMAGSLGGVEVCHK